jgi:hypothetical protein
MKVKVSPGKFKGYGLVRDKNGKPKFDDIMKHIPGPIWDQLTNDERQEIEDGRNTRGRDS